MSERVASFHHCRTPGVSGQMCRIAGSVKASYHSSMRAGTSSSVAASRIKALGMIILTEDVDGRDCGAGLIFGGVNVSHR